MKNTEELLNKSLESEPSRQVVLELVALVREALQEIQQLKAENQRFKAGIQELKAENQRLKDEIAILKKSTPSRK